MKVIVLINNSSDDCFYANICESMGMNEEWEMLLNDGFMLYGTLNHFMALILHAAWFHCLVASAYRWNSPEVKVS